MYGVEISSLSSRIAKWCDAPIGSCRPPLIAALSAPRWAIRRVVSANALRPLSEKSIVTIGGPPAPFSKFCSGFLMSEPLRTGLSLMTHQLSTWPRCWSTGRRSSSRSTMMPSGTSSTSARSVSSATARSSRSVFSSSSGIPSSSGACDFLSNAYQRPEVVLLLSISAGHFDARLTAL